MTSSFFGKLRFFLYRSLQESNLLVHVGYRVICLSTRKDGLPGNGSLEDPFDASSPAKFDKILPRCRAGSVIRLLPGTYLTNGCSGQPNLPPGCNLLGSGAESTTIRLNSLRASIGETQMVVGMGDGMRIAGITFDGNWPTLCKSNCKVALASLRGNRNTIEDCNFINFGGDNDTANECFAVQANGGVHCAVRRCILSKPSSGKSRLIYGSFIWVDHGVIEDNQIQGVPSPLGLATPTKGGFGICGGSGQMDSLIIRNNTFEGLEQGIHGDTYNPRNLFIHGNRFINVTTGIGLQMMVSTPTNPHPSASCILISDNTFLVGTNKTLQGPTSTGSCVHLINAFYVTIRNNTARCLINDTIPVTNGLFGIDVSGNPVNLLNLRILNNLTYSNIYAGVQNNQYCNWLPVGLQIVDQGNTDQNGNQRLDYSVYNDQVTPEQGCLPYLFIGRSHRPTSDSERGKKNS